MAESQTQVGEPQDVLAYTETSEPAKESVFDELFDTGGGAFAEENTDTGVTSEAQKNFPEETTIENDDSYKYWQSEADKRANERDEIYRALNVTTPEEAKNVLAEYRDVMPIAKYVHGNQPLLDAVEASLRGEPIGNQQKPENQPTQVEKPVKPVQPRGFDTIDAYQDPESESYKYRAEVEKYRDDMIEYTQMENESLKNNIQKAQEQQARLGEIQQVQSHLRTNYGYSQEQADDFVNWAQRDESFSMNNLIDLHGKVRGIQQVPQAQPQSNQAIVEPQVERKVQEMIAQRERLSQPGSVANAGGAEPQSQRPVEDLILSEMISEDRQKNPWT